MQPEPIGHLHQALRLGPDFCPPDLFDGSVAHIVRGLKVHANNISHARHVAIEETYPRLLERVGIEAFHRAAELFLEREVVSRRALDALGQDFHVQLGDPVERDLAKAEWAWLEAYRAADAVPFGMDELSALGPDALIESCLTMHPAARLVHLEHPSAFRWDGADGTGPVLLVSRAFAEVSLTLLDSATAQLAIELGEWRQAGEVLERDPHLLLRLIRAGGIIRKEY